MDICIGGILNGKVRKNNENYFSIGNPHSDDVTEGEFKHEVRQFQKPYDNQQAEQISLMV